MSNHKKMHLHKRGELKEYFHCEICGSKQITKHALLMHMKIQHTTGAKKHTCEICGESLVSPSAVSYGNQLCCDL